jgi:hypothetical protein
MSSGAVMEAAFTEKIDLIGRGTEHSRAIELHPLPKTVTGFAYLPVDQSRGLSSVTRELGSSVKY